MKYLLIALITLTSAKAFAHESQIICVKKHDKHVNLCVEYRQHRHYRHNHVQPRMVSIYNHGNYNRQITATIPINSYNEHNKPSKIDKTLDRVIKIAIIKELLED